MVVNAYPCHVQHLWCKRPGTLYASHPLSYGLPIKIKPINQELKEISFADYNYEDAYIRGLGVADMAMAIKEGRPHRANGEMALHVLEAMLATYVSSDERRTIGNRQRTRAC